MTTVRQPTARPTNKAIASMIGPAVAAAWGAFWADQFPPLAVTEVSVLVGTLAGLGLAYFIKDRPNVAEAPQNPRT